MATNRYDIKFTGSFDSASLQSSVNAATTKLKPIKLKVDIDTTALQQRINATTSSITGKSAKDSASVFGDFDKVSKRASGFTSTLTQMSNAGKINKKQLSELSDEVDGISSKFSSGNATLHETNSAFDEFGNKLKTTSKQTGLLSQRMGDAIAKFTAWYLIAGVVTSIIGKIKDVVVQVKAMDSALVELNKVSNLTAGQLDRVTENAFKMGDELGRTGVQVLDAITAFKRAGYEIDQSQELAKYAITLTNVAEGITDTSEAANIFISILKGANKDISYASTLLDSLNEISNTSAITFDALASMTQRIAGTMTTLGTSVEQTQALITGAYEVLQDERVAKGLSVIGLRIQGLNEDLETEAGLQSKVNEAFIKYAGINIFDEQTGQLRNYYDILEGLAGVWGTLDKNAQTYLLTEAAGKNRADVLAAVMNNWSGVEKAMSSSMNSAGSAIQEQQAYLDSIEGEKFYALAYRNMRKTNNNFNCWKILKLI